MQLTLDTGPDDIHDELAVVPLPVHEFPWEESLAGLVLLLLVLAAIVWYRRRRRPVPIESPEDRARRRLAELAALTAPDPCAFHAELSGILVDYVEARLALRSTRLTSDEIVSEFRRNGVMSGPWQAMLCDFLARCDRAKFAGKRGDPDLAGPLHQCRRIIDELSVQAAAQSRLANRWEGWNNAAL
jgi:hypothetical protein